MKHSVNSMEKLAGWINALGPRQREALAMLYLPAGYRVDRLLRRAPAGLLDLPLGVPVLSDPHLLEPLANFDGHILPLCPIAPLGGGTGIEKTDVATADAV